MPEIGHRSRADDVTIACRKVLKGKLNVATLEQVRGRTEVKNSVAFLGHINYGSSDRP